MSLDIYKALTTAEGEGTIIPEKLDPVLIELADRVTPLRTLLKRIPWNTNSYQWNVRTALTSAGFYNESDTFSSGNSTYARRTAPICMIKAEGQVSNLLQKTTGGYIDALQAEIEGATESLSQAEERALVMGNYSAAYTDADGFDGIAAQVDQFVDLAGSDLGSDNGCDALDLSIRTIQDNGGKVDLIVVSSRDKQSLNGYMRDKMIFNWERVDQALGTVVTYYQGIRVLSTQFIPTNLAYGVTPETNTSFAMVLDTSQIVVPTVQNVSYEDVPYTGDGMAFRVKLYEAIAVKAKERQVMIKNVGPIA